MCMSASVQALKQAKNFEIRKINRRLVQARTEAAVAGAARKAGESILRPCLCGRAHTAGQGMLLDSTCCCITVLP
jgi:hypothetical protein